MAAARPPERPRTLLVLKCEAALESPLVEELEAEPELKAWTPKVVPVMTDVAPLEVTVVVTVAGDGVAVVLEQPDQRPVQEEYGPQPAVQVVHEAVPEQAIPEALVPQGPKPPGPKPPGPPCPLPQLPPQLDPGPHPLGALPTAVDTAEAHEDHEAEFQSPPGPNPVADGNSEPPEVAEKVAS